MAVKTLKHAMKLTTRKQARNLSGKAGVKTSTGASKRSALSTSSRRYKSARLAARDQVSGKLVKPYRKGSGKRSQNLAGKKLGGMTLDKVAAMIGNIKGRRTGTTSEEALPSEPTAEDIAERQKVARDLFNPAAAAAAREAFLAR